MKYGCTQEWEAGPINHPKGIIHLICCSSFFIHFYIWGLFPVLRFLSSR